jgi:hypothetical protein
VDLLDDRTNAVAQDDDDDMLAPGMWQYASLSKESNVEEALDIGYFNQ